MATLFDNIPDEPEPLKVQVIKQEVKDFKEEFNNHTNYAGNINKSNNPIYNDIEQNLIEDFENSMVDFEKIGFENFKIAEKLKK